MTSPAFPLLEGCLAESEDQYSSDTGLIVSGELEGSTEVLYVNVSCSSSLFADNNCRALARFSRWYLQTLTFKYRWGLATVDF